MDIAEQQEALRRRRFTVEEYHKMGEAGILGEDDRVELIDGEVLEMTPIGWRHVWCVRQLIGLLASFAETSSGVRSEVDAQNPITLGEHGEPRPDLVLLLDPPVGRLPGPGEVALVVEVADTSLGFDRDVKLPRYAEAGIAEAWLVDLSSGIIEVHSGPGGRLPQDDALRARRPGRVRHDPGPRLRHERGPASQRASRERLTQKAGAL
jgi:Uma2 family endonuclease